MNPRTSEHSTAAEPQTSPGRWPRLRPIVTIGAGLALASAVTAMAGVPLAQAAAGAAPAVSSSTTIRLLSVTKAETKVPSGIVEVDVDKNGAGKVVGADSLICRITSPHKQPKCAVSIDLAKGDLFFAVTGTRSGAAGRLVGGTGPYAKSSGTVVAKTLSATRARVVIRLHK